MSWTSRECPLGWIRIPKGLYSPSSPTLHTGLSPYKSLCGRCWNPLGSLYSYHPGNCFQLSRLEFRPGQGGMWQIVQQRLQNYQSFWGASALLLPQCSSFTENSAAEILAGLHIGQHILDFGGILMSFLSDLPFGPGSRVISSQQLLCVLAPS